MSSMSGAMKTKTVIIATNTRKREKNGVDVRGEKEAAGKYIEYTEEDSPISLMSVILMGFLPPRMRRSNRGVSAREGKQARDELVFR